jgi:YHS domain-containing protein
MDPMDHSNQHHLGVWDNVPSSPNEAGAGIPDMPDTSGMQSLEEMQSMRDSEDLLDTQGGIAGMTGPGTQAGQSGQSGQAGQSGQRLGMGDDSQVQEALDPSLDRLDENDPNVARDPVCGKLVDKRTAQNTLTLPGNGETLYFSSPECKANFEEDPHRYGYDY